MKIPVFFAADGNYLPFLAVSLKSLARYASPEHQYTVCVLHESLTDTEKQELLSFETDSVRLSFCDVEEKIAPIRSLLNLRDYYTPSIYYRLFIPELFPQYDKAIYLDSDITLLADLAELYRIPLGDKLVGAVVDEIVDDSPIFRTYAETALGLSPHTYFNSGVLLMNLSEFRIRNVTAQFLHLLKTYGLDCIAPDQDYLNVLCKDRILHLEPGWDKMSTDEDHDGPLYLIHYNMFWKPWLYDRIPYERFFWDVAKETPYYTFLMQTRDHYSGKDADARALIALQEQAKRITASDDTFPNAMKKEVLWNR